MVKSFSSSPVVMGEGREDVGIRDDSDGGEGKDDSVTDVTGRLEN